MQRPLVEASLLDMPIPEMKWIALPYFEGKVYSDMITEIFDEKESPIIKRQTGPPQHMASKE